MIELLSYDFMQRALAAGGLIGVMLAVIGVFAIHRGLSFMGAGIAHASFGGVALGLWLGINPVLAAIAFCLGVGWSIGALSLGTRTREDTVIGIFFASTMALGILLLGLMGGYTPDLFGYMFGSILAVTPLDLWIIAACAAVVAAALLVFGKELIFTIFDPEGAAVAGLPTRAMYFLLVTLVTLSVVMSIKVVGIVLVSALLVTPAAAASQLCRSFGPILVSAGVIGLVSTLSGLALSFWWDTASGATIVLVVTLIFGASAGWRALRSGA